MAQHNGNNPIYDAVELFLTRHNTSLFVILPEAINNAAR